MYDIILPVTTKVLEGHSHQSAHFRNLTRTNEKSIIQMRAHAYNMSGFDKSDLPNYPICGTPKISYLTCGTQPNRNVSSQCRNDRFLYWRGGFG